MHATQPVPMRTYNVPKLGLAAVLALAAAIVVAVLVAQLAWAPGRADTGAAGAAEAALVEQRHGEQAFGPSDPDAGLIRQRIGERSLSSSGEAPAGPSGVAPNPGTRGRIAQ
jgi:hypothetical protein